MAHSSPDDLLVLHAVRIQGMTSTGRIAARFDLDPDTVEDLLLDHQARGWVERVQFADLAGWTLTRGGCHEGERLLAAELRSTGARGTVEHAYRSFLPLNGRLLTVMTKWQIRPRPGDALAANDHTNWGWDEDVLKSLRYVGRGLRPIADGLSEVLRRFAFYPERFTAALDRVDRGERRWVDEPRVDSCHTVWFELHEDLLATLGWERGTAPTA